MLNYSLSSQQLMELKLQHKLCKKRKEADRIKAVYLLGKGWTVTQVEEALLLEDDAIRRNFTCYKEGGLKELLSN